jgi:hypothetical protein
MSGGDRPILFASHQPPRLQDETMAAPVAQIGGVRDPDVRAGVGHGPVQQGEAAVHAARQQRGILVIGLHHQPAALEGPEVLGERERDAGPAPAEGCVGHRIAPELVDVGDPRVLDAPQLLGIAIGIAQRCDMPRRSSTRHSSSVVPSRRRVAPGLKTACAGYGQSAARRIGLRSSRWKSVGNPCEVVIGSGADVRSGPSRAACPRVRGGRRGWIRPPGSR